MEQLNVDKIAALAIAAQGNLPVQVDKNASIAIVPEGFKVHSTEKFNAHRDRFRGTFNTNNIDSFVDYAKARGIEGLKNFINTNNHLRAEAFFNIGDDALPGHADDTATLILVKKPEFVAFEQANYRRFDQEQLIDLLDDWAEYITFKGKKVVDGQVVDTSISFEKGVRALRKVKLTKGSEVNSHVAEMGYQKSAAESMEATGVDDDLPTTIVLHTESFKGLPIESVFISVRISVKDSDPIFILRFVGKDNHDQKRADQFIEILKGKLASLKGEFYQGVFEA
ncbi:DUF2303 family protein [Acinetobacter baumannii]|uniref:DUF2303 family protein n=1 Tax=Acinetobacter baumannii TaxID=470 RepID=UPI000A3AE385|nr:DUF2303 family protein [Acinetobacter baumannii]EKT9038303.1 DUF2303 family protein [Acinetobacter baumannii]EKU1481339.1 DUF2303 family protein [Acinetobacter baumannii]EKU1567748.1 DUF2303 family protein [Acinetobacter baumannii]EKU1571398.1 DUF2303 family protein [Acinetobacter baumannii]EKU1575597.1 DUF2303 family protein [Acinetobacter baumannii]